MMDPRALLDPAVTPGLPVPFWLIQVFKVAGFALHMVPMNLWLSGLIMAMLAQAYGGQYGKRWATRLMGQMPVIVAFGVNLGIVPLLFIQVAYAKLFYPATILMAWFWLAVVVLLIPAYYGIYVYLFAPADSGSTWAAAKRAAGWISAGLFVLISFLFANGMTLMAHVGRWPEVWAGQEYQGAVLGVGLNLADATLWPRWLMVFGLALTTLAAWVLWDAAWFAAAESPEYKGWAVGFAWKLYSLGLAWFAVTGSWYVFGTWPDEVFRTMFAGPAFLLTAATALSPGLPWAMVALVRLRQMPIARPMASLIALAQLGALTLNAISRQVVQYRDIREYFDVAAQPVQPQWGAFLLFLATAVAGLSIVAWMILQVRNAPAVSGRGSG